ncbi:MAG: ribonuclease P protein component [Clostridia bacterium]|nr:ribonuclease P protein component [Clostridia bacterium]
MEKLKKLKLNKEFKRAYGRGRCFVHSGVVTYIVKNREGGIRIGITSGKKVGTAVKRNRARRVILAAFRACRPYIDCGGYDIVFVARARTPQMNSNKLKDVLMRQFSDAGMLKNETDID